jgi:hypothetical protein
VRQDRSEVSRAREKWIRRSASPGGLPKMTVGLFQKKRLFVFSLYFSALFDSVPIDGICTALRPFSHSERLHWLDIHVDAGSPTGGSKGATWTGHLRLSAAAAIVRPLIIKQQSSRRQLTAPA